MNLWKLREVCLSKVFKEIPGGCLGFRNQLHSRFRCKVSTCELFSLVNLPAVDIVEHGICLISNSVSLHMESQISHYWFHPHQDISGTSLVGVVVFRIFQEREGKEAPSALNFDMIYFNSSLAASRKSTRRRWDAASFQGVWEDWAENTQEQLNQNVENQYRRVRLGDLGLVHHGRFQQDIEASTQVLSMTSSNSGMLHRWLYSVQDIRT